MFDHVVVQVAEIEAPVCTVVGNRVGASLQVRGRILSKAGGDGTYDLTATKTGPAGHSTIRQAGRYNAAPDVTTEVGGMTLSLETGASYVVQMTITASGGARTCDSLTGSVP